MSYICRHWYDGITPEDGDTLRDLYFDRAQCTGFQANTTAYLDEEGVVDNYADGPYDTVYCSDHDREVVWEDDLQAFLLDHNPWYTCDECTDATTWLSEEALDQHQADAHGMTVDTPAPPAQPNITWLPAVGTPIRVTTNWTRTLGDAPTNAHGRIGVITRIDNTLPVRTIYARLDTGDSWWFRYNQLEPLRPPPPTLERTWT